MPEPRSFDAQVKQRSNPDLHRIDGADPMEQWADEEKSALTAKLWACWDLAQYSIKQQHPDVGAVVNEARSADLFYEALYNPSGLRDYISTTYGVDSDKILNQLSPEKQAALFANTATSSPMDKEVFINGFTHAIVERVPFNETYVDGAVDAVKQLVKYGLVRLWTAGDVYGFQDPDSKKAASGSFEQLFRLYRGGWFDLLQGQGAQSGPFDRFGMIAVEDKFALAEWEDIVADIMQHQQTHIVIVDDKPKNLVRAKKMLDAAVASLRSKKEDGAFSNFPEITPPSVVLIWDKEKYTFGKKPDTPIEGQGIVTVGSIREIPEYIQTHFSEAVEHQKVTSIVDHDSVISNDMRRIQLAQTAVLNWLAQA